VVIDAANNKLLWLSKGCGKTNLWHKGQTTIYLRPGLPKRIKYIVTDIDRCRQHHKKIWQRQISVCRIKKRFGWQ
jgi:hypothetical protein